MTKTKNVIPNVCDAFVIPNVRDVLCHPERMRGILFPYYLELTVSIYNYLSTVISYLFNEQILLTTSGSLCEKNALSFLSNAVILSISS